MSRGLWFVAGASAGVYVVTKARRLADSVTTEGLRARWQGLTHGARLLTEDVRTAQAEREVELRESLGLPASPPAGRQLTGPSAPPGPAPVASLVPPIEEDRKNDH
ncbi:DUF6167 family protein [Nocardioides daphniae]|uniref:Secreted protein n=1 Tax=Nocardioides daphniae TaxID=402297 RepID=A0A4P7UB86_9ACTN|nr:DUF6167 family protein [Nocardioides daphniae]QCC77226.1 hypothetical protein E2C04_08465 [Nocardioides daphniae]GGD26479.1 hypothetical protein GCM10007231_27360 [Nocardioides daphniae]